MKTSMVEHRIKNAEEMVEFGKNFARDLSSGIVIALVGDLGAGKTHFCKGVCSAYGYADTDSPTFKLVNEMVGQITHVFHFDFYRMKSVQEVYSLDWDSYLQQKGVILVEWADLFPEVFPHETIWIQILHDGEERLVKVVQP